MDLSHKEIETIYKAKAVFSGSHEKCNEFIDSLMVDLDRATLRKLVMFMEGETEFQNNLTYIPESFRATLTRVNTAGDLKTRRGFTPEEMDQIQSDRGLIGGKVSAIKQVRAITGCGLKEAKDLCEYMNEAGTLQW